MRPGAGGDEWGRFAPAPWNWVRQVHGGAVLSLPPCTQARSESFGAAGMFSADRSLPADCVVPADGAIPDGVVSADGIVASDPARRLAMFAADCALVGMASPEGVIGLAHCGWRGLVAAIIEEVADAMRRAGASSIAAVRGPCIGPECYEFGAAELKLIEDRLGPAVRAVTAGGALSLDLPAGVRLAAEAAGIASLAEVTSCTACDERWFSFRARQDQGRHAMVVTGLAQAKASGA
jgi:copper oxidase (laccase) domain-containing protein